LSNPPNIGDPTKKTISMATPNIMPTMINLLFNYVDLSIGVNISFFRYVVIELPINKF